MQGTVQRLVRERGFGLIVSEDGKEYFFHRSALLTTAFEELAEGVQVDFSVAHGAPSSEPGERPRAVSIRMVGHGTTPDEAIPMPEATLHPTSKER